MKHILTLLFLLTILPALADDEPGIRHRMKPDNLPPWRSHCTSHPRGGYHHATLYNVSPEEIRDEAEAGDMLCQYIMGQRYEAGDHGCEQDPQQALEWYRKSAEQGFVDAMFRLADWYELGDGPLEKNPYDAVAWYRKCAEAGDAEAQLHLGHIYFHSLDNVIPLDREKAMKWYRMAAAQGQSEAIILLRRERVNDVIRPKAEAGDAAAQFILAKHLRDKVQSDPYASTSWHVNIPVLGIQSGSAPANPEWFQWLEKSAEQGYAPAQYMLAMTALEEHSEAQAAADADAFRYLQQASDAGNADATLWLAVCYAQGKGVNRDDAKAFQLLTEADEKGNPHAAKLLAYAYIAGTGVEPDAEKADYYFRKTAEDLREKGFSVPILYYTVGEVEKELADLYAMVHNPAETVRWLETAAEKGSSNAHRDLAVRYLLGRGVDRDVEKAAAMLRTSDDHGAKLLLVMCHLLGWGVPADDAAALGLFQSFPQSQHSPLEMSDEKGLNDTDAMLLYLLPSTVLLVAEVGDFDALQKTVARLKELADRNPAIRRDTLYTAGLGELLLLGINDAPDAPEKLVRFYREYEILERSVMEVHAMRPVGAPDEPAEAAPLPEAEIYLKAAGMLATFGLTDHARRWLDLSGKQNTVDGKLVLAELKKRDKPARVSLLKHVRYDRSTTAPTLDASELRDHWNSVF